MSNVSTKNAGRSQKNPSTGGKPSRQPVAASEAPSEQREDLQALVEDVGESITRYCRKRPMVANLTVFAAGFYLGWKIKPW